LAYLISQNSLFEISKVH